MFLLLAGILTHDNGSIHIHIRIVVIKQDRRILPELIHIVQHGTGGGITIRRFMSHRLHDDLFQAAGDIGIQGRRHGCLAADMLNGHGNRSFTVIRGPAGHHLIHNDAQRIQVGAITDSAALCLFRRQVVHRAQRLLGQAVGLGHHTGDAKIRDLDTAVLQHHHIVGLDVPVDDTTAVGMLQCLTDLDGKMQGLLPVQHALALHILFQRDAVDQLHHDIIRIVRCGNIVHGHDIGMAQHGNGVAFRMEATTELLVLGIVILQDLNGHQAVQTVATGFVHHSHAAGAYDLQYFIPTIQQPADISIHIHNYSS